MPTLQIKHDSRAHRLSTQLEGHVGLLDYELDGQVMSITHTRVPREIGGRGVAAELMRSALELAAANGWTVKAVCSYAVAYMARHPQQGTDAHREDLLDEALDESFPASDSPAVGRVD
ncbi:MAG TPA: GNAT family N-acetyltransferase [Steroidobacteraceae bacterium]|nr:GNAT family N-acetyltransferase [Steroidobacteraceae bacterium]